MSHTPMKKSVFDRIGGGGGNSSPSSGTTTTTSHKSVCQNFDKINYFSLMKYISFLDTWFL